MKFRVYHPKIDIVLLKLGRQFSLNRFLFGILWFADYFSCNISSSFLGRNTV